MRNIPFQCVLYLCLYLILDTYIIPCIFISKLMKSSACFLKDEKIQNVLGHFQKDFEGGVSAENLGK